MVYLGEISYSIYLIHGLVLAVMGRLASRWIDSPSGAAATFAVAALLGSIAGGHLLYVTVEWPWRRRLRATWIDPPPKAAAD